jgi:hypothetical protein
MALDPQIGPTVPYGKPVPGSLSCSDLIRGLERAIGIEPTTFSLGS